MSKKPTTHGAYSRNYPASVRDKLDGVDGPDGYVRTLDPEAKAFLAKALNEYADAGQLGPKYSPLHRTPKAKNNAERCVSRVRGQGRCPYRRWPDERVCGIHLCYREKNHANQDAYAILKAQDRLYGLDTKVRVNGAHQSNYRHDQESEPGRGIYVSDIAADPNADRSPTPAYLSTLDYRAALREYRAAIDDKDAIRIEALAHRLKELSNT